MSTDGDVTNPIRFIPKGQLGTCATVVDDLVARLDTMTEIYGEHTELIDSDCYRNTNLNDDLFGGLKALKALARWKESVK